MTVVREGEEDEKKKKKNEEENDDDDDAHAGVVDLHECLEMVEDFINLYRGSREEDVERIEAIANEHEELHATSRKRERHMSEVIREMTKRVQNAERKTSALLSSTTRSTSTSSRTTSTGPRWCPSSAESSTVRDWRPSPWTAPRSRSGGRSSRRSLRT